jgi:N-carbamoylputrescine amidase
MPPRVFQVGILQLKPSKGKRAQNLEHLKTAMQELLVAGEKPDVLVLPEGALTGYFLQGGVRELAVTRETLFEELEDIWREVWDAPLDMVVGFFERSDNDYYNSSLYAQFGGEQPGIKHVHRKVFLPTYGVFDEERYQSRGGSFDAFETRYGKAAMVICEDAWHTITTTQQCSLLAQLGFWNCRRTWCIRGALEPSRF